MLIYMMQLLICLHQQNLNFFSYIAASFQRFLTLYQTDIPIIPFLYGDLMKLFEKIMLLIFNPDVGK